MMSSLTAFPPPALMELVSGTGLRLKTERGCRVFPASDKSSDVIKALVRLAEDNGAKIVLDTRVICFRQAHRRYGRQKLSVYGQHGRRL